MYQVQSTHENSVGLSLLEVLLEGGAELFGILDKLLLALLDRLFALRARNEADHLVDRVQQLLDGTGDFPGGSDILRITVGHVHGRELT